MTPEALGRTGAPAWLAVASCLLSCAGVAALPPAHASPRALYASYCSTCHGADRMGGLGPPLLPGDLVDLFPGTRLRMSSPTAWQGATCLVSRTSSRRNRSGPW